MTHQEASRFTTAGFIYSLPYDRVIPVKRAIIEADNNYLLLCRDNKRDYYFTDAEAIRMSTREEYVRQEATRRVEQTFNVHAGGTVNVTFQL